MCGIHLIVDKTSLLSQIPIRHMQQALYYRGPDAVHTIVVESSRQNVYIAQNRLRITDIEPSSDKIFQSVCGRYTLAYNGEIYNYQPLREVLARKYTFQTHTDTEVLLYLLIEEGTSGLQKINGMFAFVFYDRQESTLLLCRDRFGMKPLYYTENEKYLIVSSEIKAILASGLIEKKLNAHQIPYYLQFKFAKRPQTFYENIYEIMPDKLYIASSDRWLEDHGKIPAFKARLPEKITAQHIETTLIASLERHLQTEVPVGLFLSGGVDSTLLLAISQELGTRNLPVFSIANDPAESSFGTRDYHFAHQAARQYGAEYHPIEISSNLLSDFTHFVDRIDQPIGDGATWLTFLLAVAAKPHVKVVLSGAGADELFAGYHRHWAYYQYLKQYPWLKYMLPFFRKTACLLPTGFDHPFRNQFRLVHKMLLQAKGSKEQAFINFTSHLTFLSTEAALNSFSDTMSEQTIDNSLRKALCYDQANFLSADVLALTDRMTMQASIEARLPYLDAELTTLMESVPASFLLKSGRKWLLKEMLLRRGGEKYVNRRKEGLGMPFGKWLKTEKGKPLVELLNNRNALTYQFISYDKISRLLRSHLAGKLDYSSELWTITLLIGWIEKEFGKGL